MALLGRYFAPQLVPTLQSILYKIIAEYPAFQSGDECINENNSLLIGITWDADRDAPLFKAGRVHSIKILKVLGFMSMAQVKSGQPSQPTIG